MYFREDVMHDRKRYGLVGLFLAMLMLGGMGSLLSACNTVAGAGRDVSDLGRNLSTDAARATPR